MIGNRYVSRHRVQTTVLFIAVGFEGPEKSLVEDKIGKLEHMSAVTRRCSRGSLT